MKKILGIVVLGLVLLNITPSLADVKNLPIICRSEKSWNISNFEFAFPNGQELFVARDQLLKNPSLIMQKNFIKQKKSCPDGSKEVKPYTKKTYERNRLEINKRYIRLIENWSKRGFTAAEFEVTKFLIYVFSVESGIDYHTNFNIISWPCYDQNIYGLKSFSCLEEKFTKKTKLAKKEPKKKEPTQTQEVAKLQNKITKCPDRPEELGVGMGMEAMFNSCYVMKELWSKDDTIKFFGDSQNSQNPNGYEYFWGHIKKSTQPTQTSNGYSYKGKELVMQRNGSWCQINLLTQLNKSPLTLSQNDSIKFQTNCGDFSKSISKISYDSNKDIFVVDGQNIFISDDAGKLRNFVEKRLGEVLDTREKIFAAELDKYIDSIKEKGEKPSYDQAKSAKENWEALSSQLDRILRAEYNKKKKEKKKIAKKTQEKFKPEDKDIDNDAPVIEIAEAITVDSQAYTLKGKVKDKSKIYLTIDGRQVQVKKGKFKVDRFNIDPGEVEEIKIVAIDKWNNKTEKTIKVTIDLKSTELARSFEDLKPNSVRVKTDKNKIAIIIGIEKYENLTNLDAKYANRDAKAFRAYATKALGVKSSNIKLLVDDKATRSQTLKAFKLWLPKIAGDGGKDIHIFFAGHGLASDNGEDLYILPQDGESSLLEDTAISRVELISLIQKVNPKSVTMFFDTCYSGQTRDERLLVASLRPIRIVAEEQDTPNNFTIFTASNFDQTSGSIEEAKHGMFSYYLMKGLEGKADANKDDQITNGELIAYLKTNVSKEAFTQNREQDPMLSGDPDQVLMRY